MNTLSLWTRRDPFADLDSTFNTMVRDLFATPAKSSAPISFTPAAEVRRSGDDALIRLELPGVDVENDVAVELQNGRLTIRGERRSEYTDEQEAYSLREVRYGSFERSFGLPAHVRSDAVTASYDAGVLSVTVAGVYAGTTPQRIAITSATPAVGADQGAAQPADDAAAVEPGAAS